MTDIPEEFQDVPRLVKGRNRGKPDFRTKRGKELKAWLAQESDHSALSITGAPHVELTAEMNAQVKKVLNEVADLEPDALQGIIDAPSKDREAGDERFPQAPQEPAQAVVTAAVPSAIPIPNLGTSQSGQWLLAQIAEAYPEVRYNQWNRVKATFVHAQRNLLAWRRLTQNR